MKRLSFGARGLKNREETAKENENGDIARGGRGRESLLPSSQFTHDEGLFTGWVTISSGKSFGDPTCVLCRNRASFMKLFLKE